ncbi:TRAP transporter small permease [Rhodobacteraceae bacterium F11138]|nr:TRAP transporter small permease [Rhodobacteraceae bacterium F11138]
MQRVISAINAVLSGFTGWLMFAMMLILVADFVARLFGLPLQDMAQLSVFVMMIVVYLGFSRCEEHHEHVGLEFITNRLPDGMRRRLLQFSQILAVLTVGLLLYAVAKNAGKAYVQNEAIAGAVQIPTWPTKFIMVLGLVAFLMQAILNIAKPPERGEVDRPDGGFE